MLLPYLERKDLYDIWSNGMPGYNPVYPAGVVDTKNPPSSVNLQAEPYLSAYKRLAIAVCPSDQAASAGAGGHVSVLRLQPRRK